MFGERREGEDSKKESSTSERQKKYEESAQSKISREEIKPLPEEEKKKPLNVEEEDKNGFSAAMEEHSKISSKKQSKLPMGSPSKENKQKMRAYVGSFSYFLKKHLQVQLSKNLEFDPVEPMN